MEGGSMKGEQEAMIDLRQPLQRAIRSSPFPVRLYQIVDDPNTDHIVSWSPSGDSLIVSDPSLLAQKVLPMYFNHDRFKSFTRQLNIYGFRKIHQEKWEFAHEGFKAGQRHLLETIKRQNNSIAAPKVDNVVLEKLLDYCSQLRVELANHQEVLQGMERKLQQMEFLARASLNPTVEGSIHRRKEIKEINTIKKRMLNAISSGGNTKGEAYAAVPFGAIMSDADVGKAGGQLTCEENASSSPIIVQSPIRQRKAMKEIDIRKRRRLIASSSEGVNVTQQEELGAIRSNIACAPDKDSTRELKDWKGGPILSTSSKNVSNADGGKVREKGARKMVREKGAHSNSIVVDKGKAVMEDTDRSIASSSGTKFEEKAWATVGVSASQQELGPNESNIAPPNDSTSELKDLKEWLIPSTSGTNCWDDPLFTITEDEAFTIMEDEAFALGEEQTEDDVAIEDFLDNNLNWFEIIQILNQVNI